MKKKEKIIKDSLMHILLDKKLKYIEIDEIIKKAKISTKEFNIYYQNKEQIIISFFSRIDSIMKKKN